MASLFKSLVAGIKADVRYGTIEEILRDAFGGRSISHSGNSVTWQTALQVTTVLACARRRAEAITVPCKVYKRDPVTGTRSEAREHPLWDILGSAPNPYQSGLEYRETIGLHLAIAGNHYSYISRVGKEIEELVPFDPACVEVLKDPKSGEQRYRVRLDEGVQETFGPDEIWHIRGPSWSGTCGLDAVRLIREAVGLAAAAEETHARFHSNGAQPGGILTTDKALHKDTRERLKKQWAQEQVGLSNKFRTLVLDMGMKFQPLASTGVDAQHIETRQFQVEEICRGMLVMPIMVGYSGDKAPTYASAEQMFLQHLVHTVRPEQDRVAQSADRWLLTPDERAAGYYVAFTESAFLSPDMKSKAEYYKIALGGGGNPGWLTPNQVRAFDEQPPEVGGDRLFIPVNVTPIGDDGLPMPVRRETAPASQER